MKQELTLIVIAIISAIIIVIVIASYIITLIVAIRDKCTLTNVFFRFGIGTIVILVVYVKSSFDNNLER